MIFLPSNVVGVLLEILGRDEVVLAPDHAAFGGPSPTAAALVVGVRELFHCKTHVLFHGLDAHPKAPRDLVIGEFVNPVQKEDFPAPRRHRINGRHDAIKTLGAHQAAFRIGRRVQGSFSTIDADHHRTRHAPADAIDRREPWRYPASLVETLANPPLAHHPKAAISPTKFNLDYTITGGRTPWRPIGAFDDGRQVFIEMPEAILEIAAPPLFILGDAGEELVNYRIEGRYYIVDRLFDRAEFSLGTGWNKKTVRIARNEPLGGGHD